MILQYPLGFLKDSISGSLVMLPEVHYQIHTGASFRYSDSVTLASAATQTYLLTTPNTTTRHHLTFRADGSAITSFLLYEGADRTGTTSQTLWNADRNSASTATMTIHKGTSGGSTDGTLMVTYSGGASQGASKHESQASYDNEWILKQNTKYLFKITSGTADNLCNVDFQWYERS